MVLRNVFDRPVDIRTTNKCENWNRDWNDLIGAQKPNFWTVLKKLTIQELESRRQTGRFEAPPKKTLQYIVSTCRLKRPLNNI